MQAVLTSCYGGNGGAKVEKLGQGHGLSFDEGENQTSEGTVDETGYWRVINGVFVNDARAPGSCCYMPPAHDVSHQL